MQGWQMLDQVLGQGPIHTGLEQVQGKGIQNLSAQPAPAPHHPLPSLLLGVQFSLVSFTSFN